MAEQTASKMPQIRFKGFVGEWEEILLGEIYTKIRNAFVGTATPYYTPKGHFYLQSNNVKNGEINRNTEVFINEEFYLKQKDNWLRTNDIVMVQSGHVGHTAVIPDELDNSAAHALIIISKPLRDTCSYYLNFYFQGNRARRELANIITGNTIKHILASDIKKFGAFFADYEEQTQIGEYFRELDSLIGLHQRKHDKLVTLKKAMLQKMFPQPGATTPEIRFKGFSEDWVEKKLGELSSLITKGTTPLGKSGRGLVNFVKIENIDKLTGKIKTTSKISETEHLNYLKRSQLKAGDILFSIAGTLGRVAVVHESLLPANTNQALAIIRLAGGNVEYITTYLKGRAVDDFVKKNPTVGAQPNLSLEQVGTLEVLLPPEREQQKIGTYFRTLDSLISKHATQLQKLQQLKSACLQRMFV